jgi:hypothetical protein
MVCASKIKPIIKGWLADKNIILKNNIDKKMIIISENSLSKILALEVKDAYLLF